MGLVIADTNTVLYILKGLQQTDLLTANKDFKKIRELSAIIVAL
jgi:hypothetical protein